MSWHGLTCRRIVSGGLHVGTHTHCLHVKCLLHPTTPSSGSEQLHKHPIPDFSRMDDQQVRPTTPSPPAQPLPSFPRPSGPHLLRTDSPLLEVEKLVLADLGCACLVLYYGTRAAHLDVGVGVGTRTIPCRWNKRDKREERERGYPAVEQCCNVVCTSHSTVIWGAHRLC